MTLSLAGLDYVRHVAAAGSYAEAARRAGVSQPAVAQQIKRIETRFGVKLFLRRHGRLVPTPVCTSLCDSAERVARERTAAERLLTRHTLIESGEISIGLGNMMPGMAIISHFSKAYPSVRLRVESGSHERITRLVLNREVDVGILPDVPPDSRFRRKVLIRNEVMAIVPLTHRWADRAEVAAADLIGERLIFRARGSSTQRAADRLFARLGLVPEPFLTLDSRDGVYEAVANGLGVGFIWRHGTGRVDGVRRLRIAEMTAASEEFAFALVGEGSDLIAAFFDSAAAWRARQGD
ncbi:transcriptional regulator [Rhodovulum sp. P5]|uniref:LysR family transcriptional regulator n=1 Tax=Rhodovulum sp. P5 TaxID=1564506 RepID=UPI0009C2C9B3|nr:LysR family transcriptional regulator [Rhodovulum sp. P5]ARE39036.1 transcriptional regulator [Rhodovulum sp. P5]